MKKNHIIFIVLLSSMAFLVNYLWISIYRGNAQQQSQSINLSATIQQSLAMTISDAGCDFGTVLSGARSYCGTGYVVVVRTNSNSGYLLGIQDNISGSGSALAHEDNSTRIPDFSAGINSPEIFDTNDEGVGITVYAADTNKETKWGQGTNFNSSLNRYAGIPELLGVIHTSPGYKSFYDSTHIGFVLGVNQGQKVGYYSGNATLTSVVLVE